MTYEERKILDKYARAVGISYEVNDRTYLKGSPVQREIDLFQMKVFLHLTALRKIGVFKTDAFGRPVDPKQYNEEVQKFIKSQKNVPAFFTTPLPKNDTPQTEVPTDVEKTPQEPETVDKIQPDGKVEEKEVV